VDIQAANRLTVPAFVDAFGDVAEHSPWVAERAAWRRPFAGIEDMVEAFGRTVGDAAEAEQLALIRAHPDLAGRAATMGRLTEASSREQAGAGLNRLSAAQFARFHDLNDAYQTRFGFPFIFAVKGATVAKILRYLEERLENTAAEERAIAIDHIGRIIRFRLEERLG